VTRVGTGDQLYLHAHLPQASHLVMAGLSATGGHPHSPVQVLVLNQQCLCASADGILQMLAVVDS
jgi:hypothetical protein